MMMMMMILSLQRKQRARVAKQSRVRTQRLVHVQTIAHDANRAAVGAATARGKDLIAPPAARATLVRLRLFLVVLKLFCINTFRFNLQLAMPLALINVPQVDFLAARQTRQRRIALVRVLQIAEVKIEQRSERRQPLCARERLCFATWGVWAEVFGGS